MATRTWIGGAPVVEYTVTVTIAGTWVAGETLSVTIDGLALTLTIGSTVDNSTIADNLKKAWEGEALGTGYSANFLGTASPRHYELIATVSGAVVTLTERPFTSVTDGRTFPSLSVSETSTSGTITLGTPNTPTGPYSFDNAANWRGGVVPADTDIIVIEGPYDVRYGLDQSATPLTTVTVRIPASFVGQFGLPRIRSVALPAGETEFEEYRETYFKTNLGGTLTLIVGEGDGDGPTLVKCNSNASSLAATVYTSGENPVADEPAVLLCGTTSGLSVKQYGGTVGVAFYYDDPTTSTGTIEVTQLAGSEDVPVLTCGAAYNGFVTSCKGGIVTLNGALASGEIIAAYDGGTINVNGTLHSAAVLRAYGGTINVNGSGTIGTVSIANGGDGFSGSVSFVGGMASSSIVITTCTIYNSGCALSIPAWRNVTVTNDIALAAGLRLSDVILNLPPGPTVYKIKTTALS